MLEGQRLQPDRYTIVPRTLSFLLNNGEILLLKIPEAAGAWAGKFNGVGGHIEKGEDPLASAKREIQEETGLHPKDLSLCGLVMVDTGSVPGIGLYVFGGKMPDKQAPSAAPEGHAQWLPVSELERFPLVEDLHFLIPRTIAALEQGHLFSAQYRFDDQGGLQIEFALTKQTFSD